MIILKFIIFLVKRYLNFIYMLLLAVGIIQTRSALPLVPVISTYIFGISPKSSPESHFGSDFYKNPLVIGVMAAHLLACIALAVFVMAKNGVFTSLSLSELPLFWGSILLSNAFLLGGAFSGVWEM